MNKWLAVQASAPLPDVLSHVRALEDDPVFDPGNPNKMRALIGAYSRNHVRFHDISGDGYRYVADKVIDIDGFNPSMAASIAESFRKYGKLDKRRKALVKPELERILRTIGLSKDVFEIATKTLASG